MIKITTLSPRGQRVNVQKQWYNHNKTTYIFHGIYCDLYKRAIIKLNSFQTGGLSEEIRFRQDHDRKMAQFLWF